MTEPPAPPPEPPAENPFVNFDEWLLADTMGDLDVQAKTIAGRMKLAKAEMNRRRLLSLTGTRFNVSKGEEDERRLDTAGLKKKYGLKWYEGWYKKIKRTKWIITDKAPAEVGR